MAPKRIFDGIDDDLEASHTDSIKRTRCDTTSEAANTDQSHRTSDTVALESESSISRGSGTSAAARAVLDIAELREQILTCLSGRDIIVAKGGFYVDRRQSQRIQKMTDRNAALHLYESHEVLLSLPEKIKDRADRLYWKEKLDAYQQTQRSENGPTWVQLPLTIRFVRPTVLMTSNPSQECVMSKLFGSFERGFVDCASFQIDMVSSDRAA